MCFRDPSRPPAVSVIAGKMLTVSIAALIVMGPGVRARTADTLQQQYAAAVERLVRTGTVAPDKLLPLDPLTRADAVRMLVSATRLRPAPVVAAAAAPFRDVVSHHRAGDVAAADAAGWVRGYGDGTFRPDRAITYHELIAMLVRVVGRHPVNAPWPRNYEEAAEAAGIVVTAPNLRVRDGEIVNRGSAFVLLDRVFGSVTVEPMGATVYELTHPDLNLQVEDWRRRVGSTCRVGSDEPPAPEHQNAASTPAVGPPPCVPGPDPPPPSSPGTEGLPWFMRPAVPPPPPPGPPPPGPPLP